VATETSTAPEVAERPVDWVGVGVGGAAVLFAVVFGIRMITEYRRFAINAFDFAIFDQALWLLSRFETPFSTVRGLLLFGDHSSYILLPLAPLYWVLPQAEALLVLTVVVMAVGGPLAYLAARAVGAPRFMAALVGLGYLAHPAVGWNARDGFHPEQFVLPLLIGAFLLFARDRDRWAIAVVVIALLAKEDVGMVVIPFALFVWWFFGKRRQALITGAFAVAAMAVSFGLLIPHFSPTGELLYAYRYADLGQGVVGIASGLVIHPEVLVGALADPARIGYLAVVLLPIPLALFEPRALLIAVPATVANVVSHSHLPVSGPVPLHDLSAGWGGDRCGYRRCQDGTSKGRPPARIRSRHFHRRRARLQRGISVGERLGHPQSRPGRRESSDRADPTRCHGVGLEHVRPSSHPPSCRVPIPKSMATARLLGTWPAPSRSCHGGVGARPGWDR